MTKAKHIFSADERKTYILDQLKLTGKVRVIDLSMDLNVSGVTIRNDLNELEQEKYLERVHGGAIQSLSQYDNMNYNERMLHRKQEKFEIAQEVAKLVNDGDTVALNSGTTSSFIALALSQKRNIKLITNSISIATKISPKHNINTILLGGFINQHYLFTYGRDAVEQMGKFHINKSIISVDGISVESGITSFHEEEAELTERMLDQSKIRIVAADYTKIGRQSFIKIKGIEDIDRFVTDSNADPNQLEELKKQGAELIIAPKL